jgi:hypothetical protein
MVESPDTSIKPTSPGVSMRGLAVLSVVAVTACASAGPSLTPVAQQTMSVEGAGSLQINSSTDDVSKAVPYSRDAVWAIMPTIYDSLGIPIETIDSKDYIIGNKGFKTRQRLGKTPLSRLIDCGQTQVGPNADSYDVYMTVLTALSPGTNGSTVLTTSFQAQAKPVIVSQAYQACTDRGELTSRIIEAVRTKLMKK